MFVAKSDHFLQQCLSCKKLTYRAFDVAENTARGRHLTGRICSFCCDGLTFLSLQRSIALGALKLLIEKKNASKDDSVAAVHRAAQNVCKDFGQCVIVFSIILSAKLLSYYYFLVCKLAIEFRALLEFKNWLPLNLRICNSVHLQHLSRIAFCSQIRDEFNSRLKFRVECRL